MHLGEGGREGEGGEGRKRGRERKVSSAPGGIGWMCY